MPEGSNGLYGKASEFVGKWTSYSVLGSFLLYLFGYLALRFQLYAYGVAANLDAFDEKYLFAGCRFLVFLGLTLPSILLLLAILFLPLYLVYRLAPASVRSRLHAARERWLQRPLALQAAGCALALLLIQFVLRQCTLLSNMLLRERTPEFWIHSVLLAGDAGQAFYFMGVVVGTGLSTAVLIYTLRAGSSGRVSTALTVVLSFLVAVEFLLLPVNYGVLINSTELPRVSQIENQAKLAPGASAWLVWESKEALTYLVCENSGRTMISIPKKENRIFIVGYDPIFQFVARPPCSPTGGA